ncbi:hypothetical protein Goklo_003277, partial [Gossypium klotzschianum]|nr:hypothetical protein [Gossypium klotzschianum]
TVGKRLDFAVVSEEDKGIETVLLGVCHHLWSRFGCHWLRCHATYQLPQPSVGGPAAPKRLPRIPHDGESEPRAISGIPWGAPVER